MSKAKVAVLKTNPETVVEDYGKLIRLAEYEKYLPKENMTNLKINVSWQVFFPACSTTPWQLDGVIKTMLEDGYKKELMYGCHNRTVVVDGKIGEVLNKQRPVVVDKYGLENIHLQPDKLCDFKQLIEKGEWIEYQPEDELLVIPKIFPHHYIPKRFFGENIIHLPTLKTHVHTTMTGAMKNAFGVIIASGDMVAIDAVASKIMGFEPMEIKFIRLAHEKGLGCGDLNEIEIVGDDISHINLKFKALDNLASKGQKMIYRGILKPFENLLMKTKITPWSYLASRAYYDWFWYNVYGRRYIRKYMSTRWGRLFKSYPG